MQVNFGSYESKYVRPKIFLDLMHYAHKNRKYLASSIDRICALLGFTDENARKEVENLFTLKHLRLLPWHGGWDPQLSGDPENEIGGYYATWLISSSTNQQDKVCVIWVPLPSREARCLKRLYLRGKHFDICNWSESDSE